MDEWYLQEPGGPNEGPFTRSDIIHRIAAGVVSREAKICKVGEERWELALESPAFAQAFTEQATELPKLPAPPPGVPAPPLPPPKRAGSAPSLPLPRPPMASSSGLNPMPVPPQPIHSSAPPQPQQPFTGTGTIAMAPQVKPPPFAALFANKKRLALIGGLATLGVVVLIGLFMIVRAVTGREARMKAAVVRVTTPSGAGTGFFIAGPDEFAYVATAFHVIDRGEPILIERDVDISDKKYFVEAFPETEVVAFDADSDLAIIRIKNVSGNRFEKLPLANEPAKDAKILSFGFPASSLAKRAGLISKDGKILSLVKFPVYDRRYARVVRDNAIDGVLVSTDIEPGFSGGPTCTESGDVVGVNVTKDRAHIGQNGAVSVVVLKQLVSKVKPAKDRADPTPEEVAALLKRIQSEYLLLPIDDRTKVRETEFLSSSDLPALRKLVNEIRRHERNSDVGYVPKLHISGQAALGIFFARLPGKPLETYLAPSTKGPITECEVANQRLLSFLDALGTSSKRPDAAQAALDSCDELAMRPLAWDLIASSMQWEGKERQYTVTKIDRADDEGSAYRASVRMSELPSLVEVWVSLDQGKLRLKLFDGEENLYALKSPSSIQASALAGSWTSKTPRVTDAVDRDAEIQVEERLSISAADGKTVTIRHEVHNTFFVAASKRGGLFRCSRKPTFETGLLQSFTGNLENGVVVALPQKDAERIGADSQFCAPKYTADRVVAVKLVGGQLYMYRTNGVAYPEAKQFTKE